MKLKNLVFIGLLTFSGCQSPEQTAVNKDPGPSPTDTNKIVHDFLSVSLKDPHSIQDLSIEPAHPATQFHGLLLGGYEKKWASCVTFNAKNGFGAYTGPMIYVVWIKNGSADGMQPINNLNSENQTGC